MRKEILLQFGRKVRDERKKKGISQEELAIKANLHRTYVGMVERGERNITLINIKKIADALNLELRELF